MSEPPKINIKKDKYNFTEEELIEIKKFIESKRKQLSKHPESPDYIAIWTFEQHLIKRLQEIAWKKYKTEKGLE